MLVRFSDFDALLLDAVEPTDLAPRVQTLLAAESLPRQWREKNYDLRPLIQTLEVLPADHAHPLRLAMRLSTQENANGRPEEVLAALGIDPLTARIRRTALIFA